MKEKDERRKGEPREEGRQRETEQKERNAK